MTQSLSVTLGHHSSKGRKALNQDFHGACIPSGSQLSLKGIAVAMADGVSSSGVSQVASETSVKTFLDDYYCTSEAWPVRRSAERVIAAANAWLHAQTMRSDYRYNKDKGYVCTFSALVLKADRAHVFHVGDTRVYRLTSQGLEQLTHDHRLWVAEHESQLSRALGINAHCELDYRTVPLQVGDIFMLATDGLYEFLDTSVLTTLLANPNQNLDSVARALVAQAYENGSQDNLSVQLVRVDQVPNPTGMMHEQVNKLPLPPPLDIRKPFDGYTVLRKLHASSRSHVYLARDEASGQEVVLKMPSIDQSGDPAYLERLLTEEWIARRMSSPYVMCAGRADRPRNYLYTVSEYLEGQTLSQWLLDNPKPDIEAVRTIVEQVAKGLYAFHRMEMLYQDLKPDNIMIDRSGTVKLIDFGSVRVAGLAERSPEGTPDPLLGTALYTAPEYFLGEPGTVQSDLYSLGVLTYHLLSGRFPYGTRVSKSRTLSAQRRLQYLTVLEPEREIPAWVDFALRKALHPNPYKRYEAISEFIADLRRPNQDFINKARPPLLERNPVAFWQGLSLVLAVAVAVLASQHI